MSGIVQVPSPHKSPRDRPIKLIVLHGDAGKTDQGTVSWIKHPDSKVSYHYLIGRDETVYQFVPEDMTAWHAGKSEWPGCNAGNTVNRHSIGVAFANDGQGERYKPGQYRAGAELVADICGRHWIPAHMIRGHYEVSPGRKTDPWDYFDWGEFYRLFGLYAGGKA